MDLSGFSIHVEFLKRHILGGGMFICSASSYGVAAFSTGPGAGTLIPPCIAI